jgi:tetratricopeptide (TPR) repeat protein
MSEAAVSLQAERTDALFAGKYKLNDKLGEGGMGIVYRATEQGTGRVVALKQLLSSMAGTKRAAAEALFEREYHSLMRLKHPRIIEAYDYGLTPDGPYYTMELLEGQDLVKAAPLDYRDACRYLRDIASSLALVHAQRWVHRDVSPRNVRLTQEGRAKLIDFGALAPFGAHVDVIGTPTCMAPEILHCQPLDQRTDLFALGAVAYWALTRRNAYQARRLNELTSAWQTPPAPPSELVPGIPPELDALVLSLLSLDPIARPINAAAVIDELTVIGELPPEEHEQAAEHYLQSSRLVGRATELEFGKRALGRVLKGTGAEVVIDGVAGIGKTRLLRELGVEAQLKGIVALKADAQAAPESFGVAIALCHELLQKHPDLARRTAEAHAGTLAHLSEELRVLLGNPTLHASSPDHAERRARMQNALHEWFLAFARAQPLLIAVDNLQAADDNSAAFLAALGRRAKRERLVILVTQRTGDPVTAPLPVRALRKRSNNVKLGALSASALDELVQSLFGSVANSGRVSALLFERSAGNPQQCMDLAQLLVKKQIAKYAAGTWVLPFEVSAEELPSRAEEVALLRLSALSDSARKLVEALSVHTKPLSLEKCLGLIAGASEEQTFAALDELVSEQVLVSDKSQYRFTQQALREAILLQLSDEMQRELHKRAAEALLSRGELSLGLRIEAAGHLLRAGDETRGAELMATAGREFLREQSMTDSPKQVVEALSTAASVYERQGRSDYELLPLLAPLVSFGFHLDWHLTIKHAERAIDMALRITGLGMAHKLRRYLGQKLALIVSLIIAGVRFSKQRKRGVNYDLKQAIGSLIAMTPASVGTFAICYDLATVRRLVEKLEPLRLFGSSHVATLIHDFARAQALMCEGRELEARQLVEPLLKRYEAPHVAAAFGEGHFKSIYGGVLFALGALYPYEFGTKTLDVAQRMEGLGVRVWAMGADQVRLLHHALRGETERVQYYRERVELAAVQGSTSWQAEVFWPVLLLMGDALSGDTIGVRRLSEQLARRANDVPGLKDYADAANAIYLSMRGNHMEALSEFEKVLPNIPIRGRVAWHSFRGFYAEALNRAGQHQRAKLVCEEILANAIPGEEAIVVRFLEPQRQLALAEAGLGNYARAVQKLDAALARHGDRDNHLLLGLLHKARAEVALKLADSAAAETHIARAEQHFRVTRSPAAIAQWERLAERVSRGDKSAVRPFPGLRPVEDPVTVLTQKVQSELCAADDPFICALGLVMARTEAKSAYLYVVRGDAVSLVTASSHIEPPRELEVALRHRIERIAFQAKEESGEPEENEHTVTAIVATNPPPAPKASHQLLVLSTTLGGTQTAVGGLIVETSTDIEQHFVDAIAHGLADLLVKTATTF